MNKLDLIQALKNSNNLTKSEAEMIVALFFEKWPTQWHNGIELKSGVFAPFSLKNTGIYGAKSQDR